MIQKFRTQVWGHAADDCELVMLAEYEGDPYWKVAVRVQHELVTAPAVIIITPMPPDPREKP